MKKKSKMSKMCMTASIFVITHPNNRPKISWTLLPTWDTKVKLSGNLFYFHLVCFEGGGYVILAILPITSSMLKENEIAKYILL